eukprot:3711469-Amphidinium_carterae.1
MSVPLSAEAFSKFSLLSSIVAWQAIDVRRTAYWRWETLFQQFRYVALSGEGAAWEATMYAVHPALLGELQMLLKQWA